MNVSFRLDRSVPVISVQGRLDARGAAAFDEVWKTVPPETAHLVLDLTGADYLSSIGIRSLVTAEKSLRSRRGRLVLAGMSPFVARILETAGLLRELQHASNLAAAIEQALAAQAASDASTEHTIEGRLYRISPRSNEPCLFELWGDYQRAPDTPRSVFSPSVKEDSAKQAPMQRIASGSLSRPANSPESSPPASTLYPIS
jgi:anti-sigma B factor antagonist